jgi:ABC-type transport system involved in multi-copper enzyme maturation permease subunit
MTAPATGQIHDLGYKRYVGERRARDTRWTVIMRHQVATGWKTWWRYKAALGLAVLTTAVVAVILFTLADKSFRMLGGFGNAIVTVRDAIAPQAISWYCKGGFLVSLTIGAGVVARDMQSGAFTFYFARSLRPRDYVVGKIGGMALLMAPILLAGPLILSLLRFGLVDSQAEIVDLLPILPKTLAVGVLGTLVYACVPLGFSALIPNPRQALAVWATYYLIVGWMAEGLGAVSNSAIAALDLPSALETVSMRLFDVHYIGRHVMDMPPLWAALASIGAHVALAIAAVVWRVRSTHGSGIGGG